MSGPTRNAADLLRPQIEELGSLRNASTRDPRFKQWRQNTLTVIQRIWPGDTTRSERFRRVPFSPPSLKHDVKTGRDFYERGCAEAYEYLNLLLAQIDGRETGPAPPVVEPAPETGELLPGDFPTIDLSGELDGPLGAEPPGLAAEPPPSAPAPEAPAPPKAAAPPRSSAPVAGPPPVPRATAPPPGPGSVTRGPGPLPAPKSASRPAAAAPPPRISVRGKSRSEESAGTGERVNPLSDILSSVPTPPATPTERPARAPRGRKGNGKRGLKEMLGLSEMDKTQAAPPNPPGGSVAEPPPAPRVEAPAPRPVAPRSEAVPPRPAAPLGGAAAPRPAAERRDPRARTRPRPAEEPTDALALPEFTVPAESTPLAPGGLEERFTPPPASSHAPRKPEPRPVEAEIEAPEYDFEPPARTRPLDREPEPLDEPEALEAEPEPLEELEPFDAEPEPIAESEPFESEPEPLEELEAFESEPEPLEELGPFDAEPEPLAEAEPLESQLEAPGSDAEAGTDAFASVEDPLPDDEIKAGDREAAARVTAEFVMNSPVLSSRARPLQRPATPAQAGKSPAPAAAQLMQIANEVAALGVPEGQRALARATLMDLSRLIETQEISWESLRDAMQFMMQFPPLARRTLPLLMSFLDLAA